MRERKVSTFDLPLKEVLTWCEALHVITFTPSSDAYRCQGQLEVVRVCGMRPGNKGSRLEQAVYLFKARPSDCTLKAVRAIRGVV